MKRLIVLLFFFLAADGSAAEWYEGKWVFDSGQTQQHNPDISSHKITGVQTEFDKWAGNLNVTPRRVKGKKFKLGIPYRIVGQGGQTVIVEMKGPAIEIVKAFKPDLRKHSMRCQVLRINRNMIAFDVPEMQTIRMFLRRVE